MKYATVLLRECPGDTTKLFIEYYTGAFRPKKDAIVIPNAPAVPGGGISIASNAIQNLAALLPLPYMNANAVQTPTEQRSTLSQAQIIETDPDEPAPEYTVPKPRSAFSAFVDHATEFIVFLEACIECEGLREDDKVDLNTTLFEMYLHMANSKKDAERQEWETKARKLVEGKNVGSLTACPLVADMHRFRLTRRTFFSCLTCPTFAMAQFW